MGDGEPHAVEAWFELRLHEGPPDPATWEGSGGFPCYGAEGVLEAVIPDELVRSLPADARISFTWTVCQI